MSQYDPCEDLCGDFDAHHEETFHTQCVLRKGTTEQVSWIPADNAKVGNVLGLKVTGQTDWDEGWEVISVGGTQGSRACLANMDAILRGHHQFVPKRKRK